MFRVFPEEIIADKVEYTADFDPNLFDTDGRMILECAYGDEQFSDEIRRLKALSKTIEYDGEEYSDYVKKDRSVYEEENTWDAFSMYNHSFDGGESWVEFDDEVTMNADEEGEEND